jgi:LysR family hca operon transcriptional activator
MPGYFVDLVTGYNKTNISPTLGLFLSRLDRLRKRAPQTH